LVIIVWAEKDNHYKAINQEIMSIKTNNLWKSVISKNQGPWGSWDNGNKKPQDSQEKQGSNQGSNQNPDIDDQIDAVIKKSQDFIKKLFGGNSGGKGPNGKNGNNKNYQPKSIFGLVLSGLFVLWLASGIYKVDSNENGLVLYFGKFYSVSTPGLNYHLPTPFGKVIKKSVTKVNNEKFGAEFNKARSFRNSSPQSQSLMLTGDENIVDIDFQIQWQISDIQDFVFNIADPELAIRKAAESAMREVIAKTPIADALSDGKARISLETKTLLQEILDSYGAGVRIVLVQLQRADPPSQVIDAFRDVQTAKADKEREINQAQSYSNDIIPRARGEASKITEAAKAYKQQVVANAEGQASRFNAVYWQYVKARSVTRKRMYLENMEKIYKDVDKIIIDKNISNSGVVPYLPLGSKFKKVGE
jgi:membrane protease subunit HflK